uniref:Uncharacterized protein n=1 Tax=Arundo donax TaxID=35708 RepID=A0A0A9BUQ3_ARUDO
MVAICGPMIVVFFPFSRVVRRVLSFE